MEGFFSQTEMVGTSLPVISELDRPKCGACGLLNTCKTPKMAPFNAGKGKKILIVSEAPGPEEDKQGKQLVGNSSHELEQVIRRHGYSLRTDCSLTNSLICHPPDSKIRNEESIAYCRPNLIKTIKEENPKVIILLGGRACQSLIPYLWKPEPVTVEQMVGWQIPSQKINAWVCPTYHPSYLLHMKDALLEKKFSTTIKAALELSTMDRPWSNRRSFSEKEVTRIYDPRHVKEALDVMMLTSKSVAFDYETNCLKPDNSYAKIVCASVSNGEQTYAFPMTQEIKPHWKRFLLSDVEKIGQNTKFEDRWSKKIFGVWPKNVKWCGMINSHILDCRPDITSVKFQSFVRLGQPGYDESIKPFLQGKGGYGKNRIDEVPMKKLLTYCGMDSLLEWWTDHAQMIEAKLPVNLPEDRIPCRTIRKDSGK